MDFRHATLDDLEKVAQADAREVRQLRRQLLVLVLIPVTVVVALLAAPFLFFL